MDNKIRSSFDKIHAETALKQKTYSFIQEKIRQKSDTKKGIPFRMAAVCASFVLLFFIGGFSYNLYITPSAYVDIDVNPSLALAVNRFGVVIEANHYNDEGAGILQDLNVRHMSYEDAVDKLIGAMVTNGYLKENSIVSATIQTNGMDREINMLSDLQITIDNSLQIHHASANTFIFAVSEEVWNHAHENHLTPAKFLAISELQQVDPTATVEDYRKHSISEINQMIQEHGADHHEDDDSEDSNIQLAPYNNSIPQDQNNINGGHNDDEHH